MSWYEIKAQGADTTEVFIYDIIGEDWFGDGVTAKGFLEELAAINTPNISVRINSPGGNVWDGVAIQNALVRNSATVTAHIDGLAASVASLIAMAGDTVEMAENAMMMIHDPWAMAMGNAADLRDFADRLDKTADALANTYSTKTGKTTDEVRAAMRAETWYTADEAVAFGLADEIGEEQKMAALDFDLSRFRNAPTTLKSQAVVDDSPSDGEGEPPTEPGSVATPTPYIRPVIDA